MRPGVLTPISEHRFETTPLHVDHLATQRIMGQHALGGFRIVEAVRLVGALVDSGVPGLPKTRWAWRRESTVSLGLFPRPRCAHSEGSTTSSADPCSGTPGFAASIIGDLAALLVIAVSGGSIVPVVIFAAFDVRPEDSRENRSTGAPPSGRDGPFRRPDRRAGSNCRSR